MVVIPIWASLGPRFLDEGFTSQMFRLEAEAPVSFVRHAVGYRMQRRVSFQTIVAGMTGGR